jgi:hypothetical protein
MCKRGLPQHTPPPTRTRTPPHGSEREALQNPRSYVHDGQEVQGEEGEAVGERPKEGGEGEPERG